MSKVRCQSSPFRQDLFVVVVFHSGVVRLGPLQAWHKLGSGSSRWLGSSSAWLHANPVVRLWRESSGPPCYTVVYLRVCCLEQLGFCRPLLRNRTLATTRRSLHPFLSLSLRAQRTGASFEYWHPTKLRNFLKHLSSSCLSMLQTSCGLGLCITDSLYPLKPSVHCSL